MSPITNSPITPGSPSLPHRFHPFPHTPTTLHLSPQKQTNHQTIPTRPPPPPYANRNQSNHFSHPSISQTAPSNEAITSSVSLTNEALFRAAFQKGLNSSPIKEEKRKDLLVTPIARDNSGSTAQIDDTTKKGDNKEPMSPKTFLDLTRDDYSTDDGMGTDEEDELCGDKNAEERSKTASKKDTGSKSNQKMSSSSSSSNSRKRPRSPGHIARVKKSRRMKANDRERNR